MQINTNFDNLLGQIGLYRSNKRDEPNTEAMYETLCKAYNFIPEAEELCSYLAEKQGDKGFNLHELLTEFFFAKVIEKATKEFNLNEEDFYVSVYTTTYSFMFNLIDCEMDEEGDMKKKENWVPVYSYEGIRCLIQARQEKEQAIKTAQQEHLLNSPVDEYSLRGFGLNDNAVSHIMWYAKEFTDCVTITNEDVKNGIDKYTDKVWEVDESDAGVFGVLNKIEETYSKAFGLGFDRDLIHHIKTKENTYRLVFAWKPGTGEYVEILTEQQLRDAIEHYYLTEKK